MPSKRSLHHAVSPDAHTNDIDTAQKLHFVDLLFAVDFMHEQHMMHVAGALLAATNEGSTNR